MTDIKTFNDVSTLSSLGSRTTDYELTEPKSSILETFENTAKTRPYVINLELPEWSGTCPKTHQPDFACISIAYMPRELCIETKSLKLYTFAFRNYGCFMESTTNKYIDDFIEACDPYWIKVRGNFNPRGGIGLIVSAQYFRTDIDSFAEGTIPEHTFGTPSAIVPATFI